MLLARRQAPASRKSRESRCPGVTDGRPRPRCPLVTVPRDEQLSQSKQLVGLLRHLVTVILRYKMSELNKPLIPCLKKAFPVRRRAPPCASIQGVGSATHGLGRPQLDRENNPGSRVLSANVPDWPPCLRHGKPPPSSIAGGAGYAGLDEIVADSAYTYADPCRPSLPPS
jgi:hypothetical protein